eukprot:2454129-Pyramimonas_sp.AAC.1
MTRGGAVGLAVGFAVGPVDLPVGLQGPCTGPPSDLLKTVTNACKHEICVDSSAACAVAGGVVVDRSRARPIGALASGAGVSYSPATTAASNI